MNVPLDFSIKVLLCVENVIINVNLALVLLLNVQFVQTKTEILTTTVNVNLDSLMTVLLNANLVTTNVENVLDLQITVLFVLI